MAQQLLALNQAILTWSVALMVALHAPYLVGLRYLVRFARGQPRLERDMSYWRDMLDWLGGYPFEVASPGTVVAFSENRGFRSVKHKTCGRRHGCNEFVLERRAKTSPD